MPLIAAEILLSENDVVETDRCCLILLKLRFPSKKTSFAVAVAALIIELARRHRLLYGGDFGSFRSRKEARFFSSASTYVGKCPPSFRNNGTKDGGHIPSTKRCDCGIRLKRPALT